MSGESAVSHNFVQQIVESDLKEGRVKNIVTRFPPEPNGYLHIGHAKSICLNFGLAKSFGGKCHLRFDDTNPVTEDEEFMVGIQNDIKWLGFDWGDNLFYASDYFEQLYSWALYLIDKGLAYVDDSSIEELREMRGSLTEPGKNSPFRERTVEENKNLFERMKEGEFQEGSKVLRAKIDMSSGNMNMRDPILYRIRKAHHPRTGDKWLIYPMYDFAHGQSDAIEGISHSVCTLEFEAHRELYDWFLEKLPVPSRPHQYEFARLNLDFTVMSKRKLLELVQDGNVNGWDDPRMPTLCGMRRRGFPAEAIRNFCEEIGVTKKNSVISLGALERCVRDVMDRDTERVMAVVDPVKLTISNYPEGEIEILQASKHPKKEELGKRDIPFNGTVFIDREDFSEEPPPGFHRLKPGGRVRLRYAYVVICDEVVKDSSGRVQELKCTYLPETKGGKKPSEGGKVKGIIHWVPATEAKPIKVREYDRLFNVENPLGDKTKEYKEFLNPKSLTEYSDALIEPSYKEFKSGRSVQFERLGFFTEDVESSSESPIFNRTMTLRDTWAK